MAEKFIQKADEEMDKKGTKGSFGKVTAKKVKDAKKEGGVEEKRAIFAENMKHISEKRKGEMDRQAKRYS